MAHVIACSSLAGDTRESRYLLTPKQISRAGASIEKRPAIQSRAPCARAFFRVARDQSTTRGLNKRLAPSDANSVSMGSVSATKAGPTGVHVRAFVEQGIDRRSCAYRSRCRPGGKAVRPRKESRRCPVARRTSWSKSTVRRKPRSIRFVARRNRVAGSRPRLAHARQFRTAELRLANRRRHFLPPRRSWPGVRPDPGPNVPLGPMRLAQGRRPEGIDVRCGRTRPAIQSIVRGLLAERIESKGCS